jgi:hypothetical protein
LDVTPQPKPFEPIQEVPIDNEETVTVDFYGVSCKVRISQEANITLKDCLPNTLAYTWHTLSTEAMNNTIRDCLEARIHYNLCDWAYLQVLDTLSQTVCNTHNGATFLMAYIFCQSGYQMRLATDNSRLIMLFASKHNIYDKGFYSIDGTKFYPYGDQPKSLSICDAKFVNEQPLSLYITGEQKLGDVMTSDRTIQAKRYSDMNVTSEVPNELLAFYNSYPSSTIDDNSLSRWAMYANTPLAEKTKELIYPGLKKSVEGCSELLAVNKLLNWVQTGFVYEYDSKVWGYDRAFFAEETLYYPYCDCEDRSILFSRLVRDLLDLDVALIYYPGHLATAVYFQEDVNGDAMLINGRKFIICDPTYIGAPVGAQMPDLEYDKAEAILLTKK